MTKKLIDILQEIIPKEIWGDAFVHVSGISFNSNDVKNGHIFFAIKGEKTDGHKYIDDAIEKGAIAIVGEEFEELKKGVTYIKVDKAHNAMGIMASNFYNKPSFKLQLIGITGTNGKTTTATLLYKLFMKLGYRTGLISTVKNYVNKREIETKFTTPNAVEFNYLLNEMVEDDCYYCFVEVSSHAIVQGRISGLHFAGGVFTNLTHEHLDYHKTFKEYLKAKKQFFDNLPEFAFALTNKDDKNGLVMLQNTKAQKYTYAINGFADFQTKIIESHIDGMLLDLANTEFWTMLTGKFNAYNILTVFATAMLLTKKQSEVLRILSSLKPVKGRFDTVNIKNITAIVDYAHTPDALKNILQTINEVKKQTQNLITVVGAGGDRDKTKRPIMAQIATQKSDKVILTSDNPRTENPDKIIEDMYEGIDDNNKRNVLKITNRKEAIKTAVMFANENDIILIAGKGHENYQEINGKRTHFDDKEIVINQLSNIN